MPKTNGTVRSLSPEPLWLGRFCFELNHPGHKAAAQATVRGPTNSSPSMGLDSLGVALTRVCQSSPRSRVQPKSRIRKIRTSGSEGGETKSSAASAPYLAGDVVQGQVPSGRAEVESLSSPLISTRLIWSAVLSLTGSSTIRDRLSHRNSGFGICHRYTDAA